AHPSPEQRDRLMDSKEQKCNPPGAHRSQEQVCHGSDSGGDGTAGEGNLSGQAQRSSSVWECLAVGSDGKVGYQSVARVRLIGNFAVLTVHEGHTGLPPGVYTARLQPASHYDPRSSEGKSGE